ncbi:hypothetical protein [Salinactinospora qingdaonensis]
MAKAWLPNAERVHGTPTGGALKGGAPRAVWQTTGSDPAALTARAAAEWLIAAGHSAHLVWNPLTGEVAQLLPATAAATGQLQSEGVDRALEGRVCVLIRVVGSAQLPFTNDRLLGLETIMAWLDSWHIPRRWPAGRPTGGETTPQRDRASQRLWSQGGHFGHSQVPGARAQDPGAINPEAMLELPIPRQRPASPLPAPEEVVPTLEQPTAPKQPHEPVSTWWPESDPAESTARNERPMVVQGRGTL